MNTFKRIITLTLALTLVLAMTLSLASCSTKLSGAYTGNESESSIISTTYTFDGKNVTRSQSLSLSSGSTSSYGSAVTGTYDIDYKGVNKGYEITFVWDEAGSYKGKTEAERTEVFAFQKMTNYIKIGDVKYVKG